MDCGCGVKSEKDPHIEPIRRSKVLHFIRKSILKCILFFCFLSFSPQPICLSLPFTLQSEFSRDSFGITLTPDCWKTTALRMLTLAQLSTML